MNRQTNGDIIEIAIINEMNPHGDDGHRVNRHRDFRKTAGQHITHPLTAQ